MPYLHEQVKTNEGLPVRFLISEDYDAYSPKHWHNSIEFVYVLEGVLKVINNDKEKILHQNDFYLFNSRDIHSTICLGSTMSIILQIPYDFLKSHIENYDYIRFDGYLTPNTSDPMKNQIREILYEMGEIFSKDEKNSHLLFTSLVYKLLHILMTDYKVDVSPATKSKTDKNLQRLELILDYVKNNYSSHISIEDVARIIHVNSDYFCRFFKQNMGITFLEYVNTVRLNHIYEDIVKTDLTITEILQKNGFTNYKLFMRLFKETYHCTPLQKRKQRN